MNGVLEPELSGDCRVLDGRLVRMLELFDAHIRSTQAMACGEAEEAEALAEAYGAALRERRDIDPGDHSVLVELGDALAWSARIVQRVAENRPVAAAEGIEYARHARKLLHRHLHHGEPTKRGTGHVDLSPPPGP